MHLNQKQKKDKKDELVKRSTNTTQVVFGNMKLNQESTQNGRNNKCVVYSNGNQ